MTTALADDMVTIVSDLLGTLEVPDAARHTFAAGLYGFADRHRFALVAAGGEGLWWLQSEDEPALVFLLADPFRWFAGYEVEIPDAELVHLGATPGVTSPHEMTVLVVVTLGAAGGQATANLQAPVVLHAGAQTGRQIVIPDARLGVQTPITLG